MKEHLCFPLDFSSKYKALSFVDKLHDTVGYFKVGLQLFSAVGPEIIEGIIAHGGKVFLDLKCLDIPNTVAEAGRQTVQKGVSMFTIHASGGSEMIISVVDAVEEEAEKLGVEQPDIIVVTVLTSISESMHSNELQCKNSIRDQVLGYAKLATDLGVDGVVCSPQEIKGVRRICPGSTKIITPGIRPTGRKVLNDDQERTATPSEAIELGADILVVGRPIRNSSNPGVVAGYILEEIAKVIVEEEDY
jgi:orotidine-5'-phosphate decarboxylase